jgi:hypothetical protein
LADGCTPASALAPAEAGAMRSRCTWANETASWNASANSARYAPNLERDRNQRIVVTLRASRSRQNHSTAPFENFSYNATLATIRPLGDSSDVLQKNIKMCGRGTPGEGASPESSCKINMTRMLVDGSTFAADRIGAMTWKATYSFNQMAICYRS